MVVHSGVPEQQQMRKDSAGGRSKALNALLHMPSVQVAEKASAIEALTALLGTEIEMANRYNILDSQGDSLMYAVESTNCCNRQLKRYAGDCAPWEVDVLYTQGGEEEKAFELRRGCTVTCCCLNRPVVTMTDVTTGQVIGSMKDPFACCCNFTFSVRDHNEQDVLHANGGCVQWGICCPLPCGPCSEVNFPVTDAQSGVEVGHIQKTVPSCCKFLFASDVDNYKIEFGAVQNPEYKALLIAMAIFIDFRYYNNSENDNPQ